MPQQQTNRQKAPPIVVTGDDCSIEVVAEDGHIVVTVGGTSTTLDPSGADDLVHAILETLSVEAQLVSSTLMGERPEGTSLDRIDNDERTNTMNKSVGGHPADLDRVCEGKTTKGRRCKNPPVVGYRFCPWHDPNLEPRSKWTRIAAQRAAGTRNVELEDVG